MLVQVQVQVLHLLVLQVLHLLHRFSIMIMRTLADEIVVAVIFVDIHLFTVVVVLFVIDHNRIGVVAHDWGTNIDDVFVVVWLVVLKSCRRC